MVNDSSPKINPEPAAGQADFDLALVDAFESAILKANTCAFPEVHVARVAQARADLLQVLTDLRERAAAAQGDDFLTVRDQFAMAALAPLVVGLTDEQAAIHAYKQADAMMTARRTV